MTDMIVSLSCCTIFLLLPYSFLYKNINYKKMQAQNLLKLKNMLKIKLGPTFCKTTKFMEKMVFSFY